MITTYLWNSSAFSKKPNSTKIPSQESAVTVMGYFRNDDDVELYNPELRIDFSNLENYTEFTVPKFNYARLPQFNRYYWIDEWVFKEGFWIAKLRVDVLASFRFDILASSQYVLRSASKRNGTIPDTYYTALGTGSGSKIEATGNAIRLPAYVEYPNYFSGTYSSGHFLVGVISNNATGVTYYSMTYSAFSSFMGKLLQYEPSDMGDVAAGIGKALFNPIKYITLCKWYPNAIVSSSTTRVISFGGYQVNVGEYVGVIDANRVEHFFIRCDLPKHPQSGSYPYTNLAPYSQYHLHFQPFGDISLDSFKLMSCNTLQLDWYVDYCGGMAELVVTNHDTGANLFTTTASFGVDVQISQMTVDYIGAGSSMLGIVSNIFTKPDSVLSAVSSGLSGIGNALSAMTPEVASAGAFGSMLAFSLGKPYVYAYFAMMVDTANSKFGSPLCEYITLASLSGYVLCSNASIEYSEGDPTKSEMDEISTALDNGVYLE